MPTYDAPLPIDDYEAVNLLWLLRVAKRLGLDTGDWLGQLTHKLEARPCEMRDPNSGPRDTEMRLEEAARKILADQLLAATQEVERLRTKPDWKNLRAEIERLRKLVERCCAELHDTGGEFAQQVADELLGEAGLAAIRHAAGVG